MIKLSTVILLLCGLMQIVSCSSLHNDPAHNLPAQTLQGKPFLHRVFMNEASRNANGSQRWHVYIEGDGRPVNRYGKPSLDPTPKRSLVLEWMQQDPEPALYLGRPCHFINNDPHCNPVQWTLARYSEDTVTSMKKALQQQLPPDQPITLIGHSGGGTLAVLLAARLPNPVQVVTLAGNLQVDKWTKYHQFTPLNRSLDPATQPVLPPCIAQWHLAGANDTQVLWQWIEQFSQNQPNSVFQKLDGTDHRQNWPLWWHQVRFGSNINQQDCGKVTPTGTQ